LEDIILEYEQHCIDLEAQLKNRTWDHTYFDRLPTKDVSSLLGFSRDEWYAYLGHLELHGAAAAWTYREVHWKTGVAIAQLKLRQDLIFLIIEKLFNVKRRKCGEIFKWCLEFEAALQQHVTSTDSREYVNQLRMPGTQYGHHGVDYHKLFVITDANEQFMQEVSNEETAEKAYGVYYDTNTVKMQGTIDVSGSVHHITLPYFPKGASDAALVEYGVDLGGRHLLDTLKGKVPLCILFYIFERYILTVRIICRRRRHFGGQGHSHQTAYPEA
jgi:hypothetical protein